MSERVQVECKGCSCDEVIEVAAVDGYMTRNGVWIKGDPSEEEMDGKGWVRVFDWFCGECSGSEAHESGFDDERMDAHQMDRSERRPCGEA